MSKSYGYICTGCNSPVSEAVTACPTCGADVSKLVEENKEVSLYPRPAGFWVRVIAAFVDVLIMTPVIIATFYNQYHIKSYVLSLFLSIPYLIYQPYMESRFGATIGKKAMKIQVVDEQGKYLSLGKAYIRFLPLLFGMVVSIVSNYYLFHLPGFEQASTAVAIATLRFSDPTKLLYNVTVAFTYIDLLTIFFNRRKRAIHDYMANSYCIRKD